MKSILTLILTFGMAAPTLAGWGGKDKTMEKVSSESIEFNKGSAVLTSAQKRTIEKMLMDSNKMKDSELSVAVWSDQPLPPKGKALSDDQQKLATQRTEAIQDFISTTKYKGEVTAYNMGEQANWLARMFNTTESELKSSMAYEKKGQSLMKEKFATFKEKGEPRKAVLVLSKK